MTATEKLRRLLDERGVEYRFNERTKVFEWHFEGTDGDGSAHATEVQSGINIIACSLTPEQAIDATLGRRTTTRHGKFRTKYGRSVPCCECCGYGIGDARWRFCPSCGAEVVEQ